MWSGVRVEGGMVTKLEWGLEGLSGTILSEIGALSALRCLKLYRKELSGSIPPTIGALRNLEYLFLSYNPLSSVVPSTLSTLTNLEHLWLHGTDYLGDKPVV